MTETQSPKRILIVIPAYNEEGKIGCVINKIAPDLADNIAVVNDCSTDQTAAEAEGAGALVINHKKNLGVGAGIRTGIDYAIANGFSIVAILSGDDQHDPNDLYGVLRLIVEDGYDFVQGSRRLGGLQAPNINMFRRILTWVYAMVFRISTGFKCTDATNGGRAFRTSIFQDKSINLWQDWLNTYQLEPYLLYKVVKQKFKVTEAPMKIIYHDKGTTKMKPFRDWWRIFQPMIYLTLGIRK
jgi:dolichol-phosphate mannosyltransferase